MPYIQFSPYMQTMKFQFERICTYSRKRIFYQPFVSSLCLFPSDSIRESISCIVYILSTHIYSYGVL